MASAPSRSSGTASRLHGLTPAAASLVRDAAARITRGDLDNAERVMTGVLALAPDHAEALRLGGLIDHRRGRLDEAGERYRRALESRPDDAWVLAQWGELKIDQGDGEEGLTLLRRGCDLQPREADLWFRMGVQLDRQGHHQAALDAAARVLRIDRAHPVVRMLIARNLQALGRVDDAAAEYRQVIAERGPRAWQAWFALVDLKTTRLDARERQALERIARDPAHSSDVRATLDFALGKVCEDADRHVEALAAFKRANAAKRRSLHWSSQAFTHHLDAIIDAFAQHPVAVRTPGSKATLRGSEVIFVVGMPRSGTTLVEQILAAHPDVEGASELPDLAAVIDDESRRVGAPFPEWVVTAEEADWERLGMDYLARTVRWRRDRPRFTDKLPDNWTRIDAIRRMLPGAAVVDCRRDPLETCWSCYKQLFAPGRADYSYDFAELAAYFNTYLSFTDDSAKRYSESVRTQHYESLIADPPTQIAALLDFCGLPFDAACLDFHKAERPIRTPSAAQVRRPLSAGTARSARYGALLDELRAFLP